MRSIGGERAPHRGPRRERLPHMPLWRRLNAQTTPGPRSYRDGRFRRHNAWSADRAHRRRARRASRPRARWLWLAAAAFLGVLVATGALASRSAGLRREGRDPGLDGTLRRRLARERRRPRRLRRRGADRPLLAQARRPGPHLDLDRRRGRDRHRPHSGARSARRRRSRVAGFPLWPLLVLGAVMAVAVVVGVLARRRTPHARVAHVLDAFRALGRSPRAAASLVGWVTVAIGMRLSPRRRSRPPSTSRPRSRPRSSCSGARARRHLPLTPGNIGVGSGAIAVALHMVGVDGGTAIAIGIAFQGVETGIGMAAGALGSSPSRRRPPRRGRCGSPAAPARSCSRPPSAPPCSSSSRNKICCARLRAWPLPPQ